MVSGGAHLAAPNGGEPVVELNEITVGAEALGWRKNAFGWEARGGLIGWADDEDLYLSPDVAYSVAQRVAVSLNESLTVTPQTLWKRLYEAGHLASTDESRETLKIRRKLGGAQRNVLHLHCCFPDTGRQLFRRRTRQTRQ
jgi:hypothetical protein